MSALNFEAETELQKTFMFVKIKSIDEIQRDV